MSEFLNPAPRFFDSKGNVLAGGTVTFYTTSTLTLKNIFSDINLTNAATNPVKLNGGGQMPFRFLNGSYRIQVKDKNGELITDRDPIGGNPSLFGAFGDWNSAVVYSIDNTVQASDGEFYISLTNNNIANDPITPSLANWSRMVFIRIWNANETYAINDSVRGSDGLFYQGLTAANLGNDPTLDTPHTNWKTIGPTALERSAAQTFAFNNFG